MIVVADTVGSTHRVLEITGLLNLLTGTAVVDEALHHHCGQPVPLRATSVAYRGSVCRCRPMGIGLQAVMPSTNVVVCRACGCAGAVHPDTRSG